MRSGKLAGKAAVVTGASRGIGREVARIFAREGADLVINYLRSARMAESVAEECRAHGAEVLVVQADVSEADQAKELVERSLDKFGKIDILVNNAGILLQSPVRDMSVEQWDLMIKSDLRSVFLCTHFALPSMIERRYGRIISTASQLAQKGGVDLSHYSAAKAGVVGFTKSLAREVGSYNITVNCVAPGPVATDMVAGITDEWKTNKLKELPVPRFGTPEEVAPAFLLLASDPDGSLFTGQTLGPNSGDVMP